VTATTRELHGLAVRSEVPTGGGELVDRVPDWDCSVGPPRLVDGPPSGRRLSELRIGEFEYWASAHESGPRRWIVRHGATAETILDLDARTITIHPDPRVAPAIPEALLAGSALAHALAADGISALHASAVEVDGSALAFAGQSGQGKSTLAALLCAAGRPAVADDLLRCEVSEGEAGGPPAAFCFRGSTLLRLREQAAALAAELPAEAEASPDDRICVAAEPTPHRRLPLAAIVIPRPIRTQRELAVERLRGRRAAVALIRAPRLLGWVDPALIRAHFELAQSLANAVPVVEAAIPWGPPFPPGLADDLVAQVLSARG
jgi:hypothetical protein